MENNSYEDKTIVIYKTKKGFTRKYANWISEQLECACIPLEEATIEAVLHYDTIIFGGGIFLDKIAGIEFIRDNMDALADKNVVIFATGISDIEDVNTKGLVKTNLPEHRDTPLFYMQSGINYEAFSRSEKISILCLKIILRRTRNFKMLKLLKRSSNFCSVEKTKDLVDYVKSIHAETGKTEIELKGEAETAE